MDALRDCAQPAGAMINRVLGGDAREKDLRGPNVTGGFVAANVLFARLQREPICGTTFGIVRDANQTPRHMPLVLIAGGKISGMRSAETKRNSKALSIADRHISPDFTRRFQ